MLTRSRPEAIDSAVVLNAYAWIAIAGGVFGYAWGPMWLNGLHLTDVPFGRAAILRTSAAVMAAAGLCAIGLAQAIEPVSRRRALTWFAGAHLLLGILFLLQWITVLETVIPAEVGWIGLILGAVLLYLAATGPGSDFGRFTMAVRQDDGSVRRDVLILRSRHALEALHSEYEAQIRLAVRREERARLARDLHDAVKQELFVIQTAAATAQTRFDSDADAARGALEQVRSSARDAMTEMDVMLDQLQSAPVENAGLVDSLRRHCEALGFRIGVPVGFELGVLPPEQAVPPGAREAILRAAQEALSNVARHARAQSVQVSLGMEGPVLVLTVGDDGKGLEPGPPPRGMGMSNLAARAREIGGTFEVVSAPGRGTRLRFTVPCGGAPIRAYLWRAAVWSVVLAGAVTRLSTGAGMLKPWILALAAVAAIAALRYWIAAYRVRQQTVPA